MPSKSTMVTFLALVACVILPGMALFFEPPAAPTIADKETHSKSIPKWVKAKLTVRPGDPFLDATGRPVERPKPDGIHPEAYFLYHGPSDTQKDEIVSAFGAKKEAENRYYEYDYSRKNHSVPSQVALKGGSILHLVHVYKDSRVEYRIESAEDAARKDEQPEKKIDPLLGPPKDPLINEDLEYLFGFPPDNSSPEDSLKVKPDENLLDADGREITSAGHPIKYMGIDLGLDLDVPAKAHVEYWESTTLPTRKKPVLNPIIGSFALPREIKADGNQTVTLLAIDPETEVLSYIVEDTTPTESRLLQSKLIATATNPKLLAVIS